MHIAKRYDGNRNSSFGAAFVSEDDYDKIVATADVLDEVTALRLGLEYEGTLRNRRLSLKCHKYPGRSGLLTILRKHYYQAGCFAKYSQIRLISQLGRKPSLAKIVI